MKKTNLAKIIGTVAVLTAPPALSQEKEKLSEILASQLSECRQSLKYDDERAFIEDYIYQIKETGQLDGMNRIVTDALRYSSNPACHDSLETYGKMLNNQYN